MSILTGTCPSCLKNKFLTEGRPFPNKDGNVVTYVMQS
jgi:hypothetical protein